MDKNYLSQTHYRPMPNHKSKALLCLLLAIIFSQLHADPITTAPTQQNLFLTAMIDALQLIINLDREIYTVIWSSLKISCIAVLLAAIFALPLGITIALNQFFGRRLILNLLNTLMALPTVIVGLLLYSLLNRQGILGTLNLLYTPTAVILGQAILIAPIIANLTISAVKSVDPRLRTTCLALGANGYQQGLIYAHEIKPALIITIIAGFGRAIGEVGIAMILGGNIAGLTRTMTTAIALETNKGEFEFAIALGITLLCIALIVNLILQKFQD